MPLPTRRLRPVQTRASPDPRRGAAGSTDQRSARGSYASPRVVSEPPQTSSRWPVQKEAAPWSPKGSRARLRWRFVPGSWAKAERACAPAPTTRISRPSQAAAPPYSGNGATWRQVSVAGLYAAPFPHASPQQPPPQPIASRPVQTTSPPPTDLRSVRHVFVAGLYATEWKAPKTSISFPVQTAL